VLRRLFNVLAVAVLSSVCFVYVLVTAVEFLAILDGHRYYPGIDQTGRVIQRDHVDGIKFCAPLAALTAILPVVYIRRRWRQYRSVAHGFPVLPAHEETADVATVQGTSESAKISN
jgi:hypothetical protein